MVRNLKRKLANFNFCLPQCRLTRRSISSLNIDPGGHQGSGLDQVSTLYGPSGARLFLTNCRPQLRIGCQHTVALFRECVSYTMIPL